MSSRLNFQADSEAPAAGPLRSLFLALAQAALASTLSAGCDSEASEPEDTDAGRGGDSAVPQDARVDAAQPRDSGSDAGLEPGSTAITCTAGQPDLAPALKTTRPIESLGGKVEQLVKYPQLGLPVSGRAELRFPIEAYVIYYRKVAGGIEVTRILHGAQHRRRECSSPERRLIQVPRVDTG